MRTYGHGTFTIETVGDADTLRAALESIATAVAWTEDVDVTFELVDTDEDPTE